MSHIEDALGGIGSKLEPQIGGLSNDLPDITRLPRNKGETDIEIGRRRMQALMPFAFARLGRSMGAVDSRGASETVSSLSLRSTELAKRLGCGKDFLFQCVNLMVKNGPENVRSSDFLKKAPSGGKDQLKIRSAVKRALLEATEKVCVVGGMPPGRKKTTEAIKEEMRKLGILENDMPCRETIRWPGTSHAFTNARLARIQGEHMFRLIENMDEPKAPMVCVQMDGTSFTSTPHEHEPDMIMVLNEAGEELGVLNAIFGIDVATRYPWTFLPVVGAVNSYLVGMAIHRGLTSKSPLFTKYNVAGRLLLHGKPGQILTDRGSEFIATHTKRVVKDLGSDAECPPGTPHYKGIIERFNRTAHLCFAAFLRSPSTRKYLQVVDGKKWLGIKMKDVDAAFLDWMANDYVLSGHAGLGGASPEERLEEYANGRKGLPLCGYVEPMADSPRLRWDFLWVKQRVIKHTGIDLFNRVYRHPRLTELMAPGRRRSEKKVEIRFNPYAMSHVFVLLKAADGTDEAVAIPWVRDNDKLPMTETEVARSTNPSMWEWESIYKTLRRAGNLKPTRSQAEALAKLQEQSASASRVPGAPARRERTSERAKRAMRNQFGQQQLPVLSTPSDGVEFQKTAPIPVTPSLPRVIKLLSTGERGAEEY